MQKINYILLLLLSVISLKSCDKIVQEYPELKDFLDSVEFQGLIKDCPIEVVEAKNKNAPMAAYCINLGTNGFVKKLLLNSAVVNNNFVNAQEFKFILCHELGHLNDKEFKKTVFMPVISMLSVGAIFSAAILKNLWDTQWTCAFKRAIHGTAMLFLLNLIRLKFGRDGELFADTFALTITKDKNAAESVLLKRKALYNKPVYKNKFLNMLRDLLEDHPSEQARIENIKRYL